jgi:hypothetical protein
MTQIDDINSCHLIYHDRFVPVAVSGVVGNRVYSGNGLFDPDITGVGHQPYGYDEKIAQYIFYQVYESQIEVKVVDLNTTSEKASRVELAVIPTGDYLSWALIDPETIGEAPYGRVTNSLSLYAGNTSMTHSMSSIKVSGFEIAEVLGAKDWASLTGSNPSAPWYWNIAWQANDESTTIADLLMYVRITYHVKFFARKVLDESLTVDHRLAILPPTPSYVLVQPGENPVWETPKPYAPTLRPATTHGPHTRLPAGASKEHIRRSTLTSLKVANQTFNDANRVYASST